jgi:hypothetical protein
MRRNWHAWLQRPFIRKSKLILTKQTSWSLHL